MSLSFIIIWISLIRHSINTRRYTLVQYTFWPVSFCIVARVWVWVSECAVSTNPRKMHRLTLVDLILDAIDVRPNALAPDQNSPHHISCTHVYMLYIWVHRCISVHPHVTHLPRFHPDISLQFRVSEVDLLASVEIRHYRRRSICYIRRCFCIFLHITSISVTLFSDSSFSWRIRNLPIMMHHVQIERYWPGHQPTRRPDTKLPWKICLPFWAKSWGLNGWKLYGSTCSENQILRESPQCNRGNANVIQQIELLDTLAR